MCFGIYCTFFGQKEFNQLLSVWETEWHNIKNLSLHSCKNLTNDKVPPTLPSSWTATTKYNNHFQLGFFGNRIKSHFISATSTWRESVLPPASACRARKKLSAVIDLLAPNLILIQIFTYLQEACKHTLGVIYFAAGQTHCNALICLLSPKQREGKNKEGAVRLPDTWTWPLPVLPGFSGAFGVELMQRRKQVRLIKRGCSHLVHVATNVKQEDLMRGCMCVSGPDDCSGWDVELKMIELLSWLLQDTSAFIHEASSPQN